MDHYFKAYHNVIRMLTDRKYTLESGGADFSGFNLSLDEFTAKFSSIGDGSLDLTGILDREGKPVYVLFLQPEVDITSKSTVKQFTGLMDPVAKHLDISSPNDEEGLMELLDQVSLIVVYNGALGKNVVFTPPALEKKLPRDKIQLFPIQLLTFCILDAEIMPLIRLLSDKESADIAAKYGAAKLEKFTANDPVVKYFGAKVGDTFELVGRGKSASSIRWRKVIATQAPMFVKK